jgi:hypothetical protein
MDSQMKKMSGVAVAVALVLASGGAWAAANSITFEGAQQEDTNGVNNAADIDASGSVSDMTVTIRQISSITDEGQHATTSAANMNQVGDYVNDSPLTISVGSASTIKIGQGVKFDTVTPNNFDDTTEAGSKNNLVKGTITGGNVYISQTGAGTSGSRVADVTVSGGTLRVNQTADGETTTVQAMAGGNLTVNQNGSGQTVTVTQFDDGDTTVNQDAAATNSSLTLTNDNGVTGNNGNSANYNVTVNQTGAYQTTTLQYVNSGYTGDLNLAAHGDAGPPAVYTTLDIKL